MPALAENFVPSNARRFITNVFPQNIHPGTCPRLAILCCNMGGRTSSVTERSRSRPEVDTGGSAFIANAINFCASGTTRSIATIIRVPNSMETDATGSFAEWGGSSPVCLTAATGGTYTSADCGGYIPPPLPLSCPGLPSLKSFVPVVLLVGMANASFERKRYTAMLVKCIFWMIMGGWRAWSFIRSSGARRRFDLPLGYICSDPLAFLT